MKSSVLFLVIWSLIVFQEEVAITHHRADLEGKTLIGNYDFTVDQIGTEDNIAMIKRAYDSARTKAKDLDASIIYINGRRWRYLGRRLVVITEIYKD